MSSRGVECVGAEVDAGGTPTFGFQCNCGAATAVAVEDLAPDGGTNTLEFAFTCAGCQTAHWVTIQRSGKEQR